MSARLFIACYQSIHQPDNLNIYHWALVVLRTGQSLGVRLRIYQVISQPDGPWRLGNSNVSLLSTARFYLCVDIGTTDATRAQLEDLLEVADPTQGTTPSLPTPASQGRAWSCEQWVIRCLGDMLVAHELFNMQPADHDAFYNRVVHIAQAMRQDPDADEFTIDGRTVEVITVNGVPTVQIWA